MSYQDYREAMELAIQCGFYTTVGGRNQGGTGLPGMWVPLYDFKDGCMAYLDYSALNSVGEPPVIAAS